MHYLRLIEALVYFRVHRSRSEPEELSHHHTSTHPYTHTHTHPKFTEQYHTHSPLHVFWSDHNMSVAAMKDKVSALNKGCVSVCEWCVVCVC